MSTSTEASDKTALELANSIISTLPTNPLVADVLQKVKEQRRLGLSEKQVKNNVTKIFKVTGSGYTPREYEDREIVVTNIPEKYNRLTWE